MTSSSSSSHRFSSFATRMLLLVALSGWALESNPNGRTFLVEAQQQQQQQQAPPPTQRTRRNSLRKTRSVSPQPAMRHRALLQHRKMEWAPTLSAIDDEYIVVFQDNANKEDVLNVMESWKRSILASAKVLNLFQGVTLNAVVVKRVSVNVLRLMLGSDKVKYIEQNQYMYGTTESTGTTFTSTETTTSWGLDRVDQAQLPLDDTFSVTGSGAGVDVYIIDSGIMLDHSEFEGRARCGYNSFTDTVGRDCDDLRGHGSHVAGVVGGKTWGIAKQANLVAVKALSDSTGSGTLASVVGAVTFACDEKVKNPTKPTVVNMSISGSGITRTLDDEVQRCHDEGVVFITSAGNSQGDACLYSPAASDGSIAVGATKTDDSVAAFSNFGTCVDVYAPGSQIKSVAIATTTASTTKSGTSMAAPHVSGAAALYLEQNPTWTAEDVRHALQSDATPGVLTNLASGSNNYLLNVGNIYTDNTNNSDGDDIDDGDDSSSGGTDPNLGFGATDDDTGTCSTLLTTCDSTTDCCWSWTCNTMYNLCWFW